MKKTLLFLVTLLFAVGALAQNDYLNENFDNQLELASSNEDGKWYVDRYAPEAFESYPFNSENVLRIQIHPNQASSNRGGQSSTFYNTQGRKFNQEGLNATVFKGDLYIPADWETSHVRTDMWITAYDESYANITGYPIIGFRNIDGESPTFSFWSSTEQDWVDLNDVSITYDAWYHFEVHLVNEVIHYYIDGSLVGTDASENTAYIGNVIMQAYNFDDPALPSEQQDPSNYEVYWDNLITQSGVYNATKLTYHPTIQEAIDDADPGDVIEVAAGDYPEDITINVAGLTLNGAGRDLTKIIGQGTGETEAVRIQADNVTVDGFEIQGNKKPVRIPIPTTGVSFVNNRIVTGDNATSQNAWVGFEVYWDKEQTDLVIDNNIFVANKTAQLVYLNKANNIQFTNNQIEGEMRPDGLTLGLGGLNGDQDISGNTFDTFTSYALLEVDGTFDILNLLSDNSWPQGGVAGGNKVHNTIQAAINAATAGDVIHVSAGEYNEDLLVNKSVSIHGAGADQTIFTNRVRLAGSFVDVSFKDFTLTRNTAPMLTAEYGNPSFDGVTFENVDFVFTGVSTNPSQGGRRAITLGFGIDATIVGNGLTFKDAIFESTNPDELSAPIMVLRADGGAHPAGPLTFDNVTVKGNGNYNAINTYDGGHVTVKNSKTEVSGAFYLSGFSELTVNENEFTGKGGVFINGVGTGATITGNTFKDIPTGGFPAINFSAAWGPTQNNNVTFSNNTFENVDVTGVRIYNYTAGDPDSDFLTATNNDFSGISAQVILNNYPTATTVNATCNWWGTTDYNQILPKVSAGVDISTWLESDDLGGACSGEAWLVFNETTSKWYPTIQGAIDEAEDGNIIKVYPGTFNEAIEILTDNLTLESVDGAATTIIDAGDATNAVKIGDYTSTGTHPTGVTIKGFTVQGWAERGIAARNGNGTLYIYDNTVIAPTSGSAVRGAIILSGGDGSEVKGNTVTIPEFGQSGWSSAGIMLMGTVNAVVEENSVTGLPATSDIGIGIFGYPDWSGIDPNWASASGNTVQNNIVVDAGFGVAIVGNAAITTVTGNDLHDNDYSAGIYSQLGGTPSGNTLIQYNHLNGVVNYEENYLVDATCNWWGSDNYNDVLASVWGEVEFVEYLIPGGLGAQTYPWSGTDEYSCTGEEWFIYNTTLETFHPTIQDAIDLAETGNMIEVPAGEYVENIVINKANLTLKGANFGVSGYDDARDEESVINGGVRFQAANITFDGFEVAPVTGNNLILQGWPNEGWNGLTISNSRVIMPSAKTLGIWLDWRDFENKVEVTVTYNLVQGPANQGGMDVVGTINSTVTHNKIVGIGATAYGVWASNNTDLNLSYNIVEDCLDGLRITGPNSVTANNNQLKNNANGIFYGDHSIYNPWPNLGLNPATGDVTLENNEFTTNTVQFKVGTRGIQPSDDFTGAPLDAAEILADNTFDKAVYIVSSGSADGSSIYSTIAAGVTAADPGEEVHIGEATYAENVVINKNISLIGADAATTIIDGVQSGSQLAAVQLTAGRNGVTIKNLHIKGLDGPTPGLEKAAIYMQGAQTNITIENNIIEARGDAALMGEWNAANIDITITGNTFTGQTFIGDEPASGEQFEVPNVARQAISFGGGASTTNTQNFTFTNNTVATVVAGEVNGNTLVTLDLVGVNEISGNVFSGKTLSQALRVRGSGTYAINNNSFSGDYPLALFRQGDEVDASNNFWNGCPSFVGNVNPYPYYTAVSGTAGSLVFDEDDRIDNITAEASETIICLGQSVTLTAGNGSNFEWDNGLGLGATKVVNPTETTLYTVTGDDVGYGCQTTASVEVIVNPALNVDITALPVSNGTELTATGATSYEWSTGETTATIIVNPATTTTYSVVGTTGTCSASAEYTVDVMQVSAGPNQTICAGSNAILTATVSGGVATDYLWTPGDFTTQTIDVSPAVTTTYTVTVNGGPQASVTVFVNPTPVANAGDDIVIPDGGSGVLSGSASSGTAPYTYAWTGPNSFESTDQNPVVNEAGTYTLTVTDYFGCEGTDEVVVTVAAGNTYTVSGNVSYAFGTVNEQMHDVEVMLVGTAGEGTYIGYTAATGDGDYAIPGVPDGTYDVYLSSPKPWGGVTSADVVAIQNHYRARRPVVLHGIKRLAADVVDNSSAHTVDVNDRNEVNNRRIGNIASFATGDWVFTWAGDIASTTYPIAYANSGGYTDITLTVDGGDLTGQNFKSLCYGDVNASYTGLKELDIDDLRIHDGSENDWFALEIYPNPFTYKTNVSFYQPIEGKLSIRLFDMMGNMVQSVEEVSSMEGEHLIQLDGSRLPAGIYLYVMTLVTDDDVLTQSSRIVITK